LPWWREPKTGNPAQRSRHEATTRTCPAQGGQRQRHALETPACAIGTGSFADAAPRCAARPLLVAGFSGLILVALSGACLIGLAAIGLVAGALGSFGLLGRHLGWSGRTLGTPNPQVLGYHP
jgi:predicted lipid-binding transport protein (Tim44 family)